MKNTLTSIIYGNPVENKMIKMIHIAHYATNANNNHYAHTCIQYNLPNVLTLTFNIF